MADRKKTSGSTTTVSSPTGTVTKPSEPLQPKKKWYEVATDVLASITGVLTGIASVKSASPTPQTQPEPDKGGDNQSQNNLILIVVGVVVVGIILLLLLKKK